MGLWTVALERFKSSLCSVSNVFPRLIEQGTKETVNVINKPINVLNEFIPEVKETDKENITQSTKTNGRIVPKVPIPQIPFGG